MKCEVCKTIARLGLEDSAHDLWYCSDAPGTKLQEQRRHAEKFVRERSASFRLKWRERRNWALAHMRQQFVTLGI